MLLKQLFASVYIPPEVLAELEAGYSGEDYLLDHDLETFVIVEPGLTDWGQPESERLDAGERAAIGLALKKGLPLLIEERLGRRLARLEGVPIVGAVGLLNLAYQRQILAPPAALEALAQLYTAGRISKKFRQEMVVYFKRTATSSAQSPTTGSER